MAGKSESPAAPARLEATAEASPAIETLAIVPPAITPAAPEEQIASIPIPLLAPVGVPVIPDDTASEAGPTRPASPIAVTIVAPPAEAATVATPDATGPDALPAERVASAPATGSGSDQAPAEALAP